MRFIWLFIGLIFHFQTYSQNQVNADSARMALNDESNPLARIELIKILYDHEQNRDTILKYGLELIELIINNEEEGLSGAYEAVASAYSQKGHLSEAVSFFHQALEVATNDLEKGVTHSNLASTYQANSDFNQATFHYSEASEIFRELGDQLRLGTNLVSLGYLQYLDNEILASIKTLMDATTIFQDTTISYNDYYWAYAAGNLALSEAKNHEISESENRIDSVIQILEKYQDDYAIADYRIQMAKIYLENEMISKAFSSAAIGANLAEKNDFRKYLRDAHEILSKVYKEMGEYDKALSSYEIYMANKDSLMNADLIRQLANQRTEFEVGQKQSEVDVLTAEKRAQKVILMSVAGFAIILIVLAAIVYKYYRDKAKVNRLLTEQKAQLEQLNSTKDRFFSIISHDLRGPVAAFNGVSRLIRYFVESKETDSLIEIADEMEKSVDQLSSLLDNLLSWAMQQQGQVTSIPEKLSLNELANDQVSVFSNMAKGKNIHLSAEVSGQVALWADKNTTTTILRNLVNNALKFTDSEGHVSIHGEIENGTAVITVKDTGVGIPEEKLDDLFKLNDRRSEYGTSGEKGLGLGLQLVNEFIELNGGELKVRSEEGKGSEFIVTLPIFESQSELVS